MNKITELLQLILDKINTTLMALGSLVFNLLKKAIPSKDKKIKDNQKTVNNEPQEPIFKRILNHIIQNLPHYKDNLLKFITALNAKIKKLEPKSAIKNIIPKAKELIIPVMNKLRKKYESLSPKTIIISLTIMSFILLASLNFYMATKKIIDETSEEEIVQVVEVKPRPKYYKTSQKQIRIDDIKMPIYVKSAKDIKSLVLDFTIQASNRYIKKFFEKNPHYLQDRLNSSIEPIVPSFPLQEEGKIIIKDKLIDESNYLIKNFNIKGRIEKVYFHNITAS